MRRIGEIHPCKAFWRNRDGTNSDVIGTPLQSCQQVAHLRYEDQLIPPVEMLWHATPQVDTRTSEPSLAVLPAVRLGVINSDAHRYRRVGLRCRGHTRQRKEDQGANTRRGETKHNVEKINQVIECS